MLVVLSAEENIWFLVTSIMNHGTEHTINKLSRFLPLQAQNNFWKISVVTAIWKLIFLYYDRLESIDLDEPMYTYVDCFLLNNFPSSRYLLYSIYFTVLKIHLDFPQISFWFSLKFHFASSYIFFLCIEFILLQAKSMEIMLISRNCTNNLSYK